MSDMRVILSSLSTRRDAPVVPTSIDPAVSAGSGSPAERHVDARVSMFEVPMFEVTA